jgi:hypothetical protein
MFEIGERVLLIADSGRGALDLRRRISGDNGPHLRAFHYQHSATPARRFQTSLVVVS